MNRHTETSPVRALHQLLPARWVLLSMVDEDHPSSSAVAAPEPNAGHTVQTGPVAHDLHWHHNEVFFKKKRGSFAYDRLVKSSVVVKLKQIVEEDRSGRFNDTCDPVTGDDTKFH